MDASENYSKKIQCKGSVDAAKKWKLHIPSRRWNSQNLWVRTASENIHLKPGPSGTRRRKKKSDEIFLQPHFKTTRRGMMRKLKVTSGRSQEGSFIVITLNPESNCTGREKNRVLFHRNTLTLPERHTHPWMCCWRKISKITGTWMEKKESSDAWTGFTRFILLNDRPLDWYTWSGRRLKRKQITSRPDNVWPDMWKHMFDAAKMKAKQRWAVEKPKLDNA